MFRAGKSKKNENEVSLLRKGLRKRKLNSQFEKESKREISFIEDNDDYEEDE